MSILHGHCLIPCRRSSALRSRSRLSILDTFWGLLPQLLVVDLTYRTGWASSLRFAGRRRMIAAGDPIDAVAILQPLFSTVPRPGYFEYCRQLPPLAELSRGVKAAGKSGFDSAIGAHEVYRYPRSEATVTGLSGSGIKRPLESPRVGRAF